MLRLAHILFLSLFLFDLAAQAQENKDKPEKKTIRKWSLSDDFTTEVPVAFDTTFSLFHQYRVTDKYSPVNASLGNYGLPMYQLSFFDRITDPDKFLYSYYYPYMFLPDKALFMDTQVPFTQLSWTFGTPRETSEQTFGIMHSQNINSYWNFGLIYDIIYSLGQYNFQRAEDKSFTFHTSYEKNKYRFYIAAGLNNLLSHENGGINGIDRIMDYTKTRDIPVNLNLSNASGSLKNKNILMVQRYSLGKVVSEADSVKSEKKGIAGLNGTFSHIFQLETNKRFYSDSYPSSGFYDSIYISSSKTGDTLSAMNLENTVRFDFTTDESRKFRLGGGVGIRNEIIRYGQITPTFNSPLIDTLIKWKRSNNVLVGKLLNNIGEKFRWEADGEMYLTGFRTGDFNIKGEIDKSFDFKKGRATWNISGIMANTLPSFWLMHWGSNNFIWNNDLKKEFRIDAASRFSYPARSLDLKFNYAIITNYTDLGINALPSQYDGVLSVVSVAAHKDFRAWKFHLSTDILVQQSSNSAILDLPLFSTRTTGYFEHLFRFESTNGSLNTQFGVEMIYNTLYHPYNYMPATGRFYRQNSVSAGNYPFLNAFLNVKLKRTRIFIMLDHLNSGMMGYEYYMIPLYPMNIRMLRYGLAWTFYN